MKKTKKEESLLEWGEDVIEFALKVVAIIIVLFSLFLFVKGLVIINKYDYMSFWEIYFMSEAEYDLEILRNNTLFVDSYDGYTLVIMAMKGMLLSLAMSVMSRIWGATTRIKYIYRCCFGKDFKLNFQ